MGELLDITHDDNNLDEYDVTVVDGGDLTTGTPGLASTTAKMEATIDDAVEIYGQKNFAATTRIRLRFYLTPNTLVQVDVNDYVALCRVADGSDNCLHVYISGGTPYNVEVWAQEDGGGWVESVTINNVTNAQHYVEVDAEAGAGDGFIRVWLDDIFQGEDLDLDTDARWAGLDSIRLGAMDVQDTTGTIYLDELKANNDGSKIGPCVGETHKCSYGRMDAQYALLLYESVAVNDPPQFRFNFTRVARNWRRTTRCRGGYWMGSFELYGDDVGREDLIQWFNYYLGNQIKELTTGLVSWEGLIYEMTLTLDGVQYRRTLDKEWFHNRVKILYRNAGAQAETAWSENTDSSDEYGEMNYIDTISEATVAAATALRDTRLTDFAFPRSRMTGGLQFGLESQAEVDSLQVVVAGYAFTLNWRYRESSIAATAASTAIADLVDDSEFVTAGIIDTNSLSVDVDCTTPQRLWDAIEDLIVQGDASGNRWVGGVYEDREFDYNQAATEVEYYVRSGSLVDKGAMPVVPSLLKPDFIVCLGNAPTGGTPIGGNVWDDPRNAWITEVEFIAPDGLVLKPAGFEDVQVLQEQLR